LTKGYDFEKNTAASLQFSLGNFGFNVPHTRKGFGATRQNQTLKLHFGAKLGILCAFLEISAYKSTRATLRQPLTPKHLRFIIYL